MSIYLSCRTPKTLEARLPTHLLSEVARLLDREANRALNIGRNLFAERCSRRAEELREGLSR